MGVYTKGALFRFWKLGQGLGMSRLERVRDLFRRPLAHSIELRLFEGAFIASYERTKLASAGRAVN